MTKVVIANSWVSPEGKTHKGGVTVDVEPAVARELLWNGTARKPGPSKSVEESKPASAEKEARK